MLILLSTAAIAGVYVPGYVIFKTTNPITVIQTEPQLLTDKAWFNQKITKYHISELQQIGADKIPEAYLSDRLYYYAVFDTVYAVKDVIFSMKGEADVVFAEPNYLFQPLTGVSTNDDTADQMWGLKNIEMDRVWSELGIYGAPNVDVAVIDSGIDLGNAPYPHDTVSVHPDLLGNVWQAPGGNYGWNYYVVYPPTISPIDNELINYPHDKMGHGTAVAGVISAINNNEFAVSSVAGGWRGIASGAKIMPFRVLQGQAATYLACYYAFLDAYYYGASVINFSLGVAETDMNDDNFDGINMLHELISDMYDDAYNWGVRPLVVVAAGNTESEEAYYPACFDEVLAVGATDRYDKRGRWFNGASTLHSSIDIVAPGCHNRGTSFGDEIGIYTTFPMDNEFNLHNSYNSVFDHASGTSLAAPHVSGVAALVLAQFPNLTLEQLRGRLLGTADYIYDSNQAHLGLMGSGRLNAYRALTEPERPNLVLNGINVNGVSTDVIKIGSTPQRLTLNLKNWWSNATNVWGLLSTDDPNVSISYAGSNRIYWGDIQTEESTICVLPITINATGFNRLVDFTLTVDSDSGAPNVMTFTMKLQTSVEEDYFCVIPPNYDGLYNNDYLNKNFTVKDINNDRFDEIFVTSRNGYLFIIHQDGSYVRKELNTGTTCTPAVGDINSDSVFEIVVGNDFGQVLVFSGMYPYNLLHTINITVGADKPKVTFITLEDMNNDGQLDIVAVYEKRSSASLTSNGFSVINMLDLQVNNYDTTHTIQHGISVDDVNNNGLKDVVFLCQNYHGLVHHQTDLFLDVVEVSEDFRFNRIYHNQIGNSLFEAGSSPIIADLTNDDSREIIVRYEWNDQGPEPLRSKKVGIKVYRYHPEDSSPIWVYPTGNETVSQIGQNDNILVGDFSPIPGLEILFTHDRLTLLDANGFVIKESDKLPLEQNTYQEYILAFDNSVNDTKYYRLSGSPQYYRMSAYFSDFLENNAWKYNVNSDTLNYPIGLAFVNTSLNSSGIVMPMKNGQFVMIPVRRDDTQKKDYSKYRYNSRHTGSYNQPLPKIITQDTDIKHNLYIENDMYFESGVSIKPTVRIVVDPNVEIFSYNLLSSVGSSESGLQVCGTCLNSQHGYWGGITLKNDCDSDLRFCTIRNAAVGIRYDYKGRHYLENSTISNNDWGIHIYHANPALKENKIVQNNIGGVSLHNGACPLMGEDAYIAGYNSISDNPTGIFSSQSNPLLRNGHNDIVNIHFNLELAFTINPIAATRNWWGSDNLDGFVQKFNIPALVGFDPWDSTPNTHYSPQTNPFVLALQFMLEEQYLQAIPLFHQVLADSVLTNDDHASINALLICYDKTNNLNYYRDFILNQLENQLPEKLVQWYKDCLALINRSIGFFSDAIAYYESKLDNSTTLADSCYAMIDLGNTYLEADFKVSGKYSYLIPKSIKEHSEVTKNLLDKIYNDSSQHDVATPVEQVLLRQNYPNPFNPSTTISFYLPEKTHTQLTIYNIKGQVVKTIKNEELNKGSHYEVWDGKDRFGCAVSSGVYFYKLRTNNKTLVRKMLMLK